MFHLVGLPLQQLLIIGGVAAGLVVIFYILKLKRRPVAVPFSKIWERILRDKQATSLFSQLKRLLSLLVQLLILLLLVLALGDPRTAVNLKDGRNVVVLIDASASMQASDVEPSRLASGLDQLKSIVRGLGIADRMMIAQMDSTITPLSTMTNDVPELEKALGAVKPTDTRADLARGLRFATDTLYGLPQPQIIVVSDGSLAPPIDALGPVVLSEETKLSYIHVGKRNRNAAITNFSVRRYPLKKTSYEAMIELTNTGDEDLDLELRLYGDERQTHLFRLKLKAGEKDSRFLTDLPGLGHRMRAEISLDVPRPEAQPGEEPPPLVRVHDDLPADDVAYALMPDRRRSKVQVVTPGDNTYLEAALLLDEYLEVQPVRPADYPAPGVWDVTIFDGVAPPIMPGSGHIFYMNPSGKDLPFTVEKEVLDDDENNPLGFDQLDANHPIIAHTQLSDIGIGRAHPLKGSSKDDKVIGASFKGALLIAGRREGYKFVALGFDIRESDLPLRIAWPLLLLNIINDFVEEDTSYISSFQTGNVWHVPAPSTLHAAELIRHGRPRDPDAPKEVESEPDEAARIVPVDDGRAVYFGERSGFYTIKSKPGDELYETEFAANLADPVESTIKPQPELKVGDHVAGEVEGFTIGVRHEFWTYLLLAVIAISAIEWVTYHRRISV